MIKLSMYILIQQGCVAQIGKTHRHTNKYTDRQTDIANAVMQAEENNSILFRKQSPLHVISFVTVKSG